MMKIILLSLLSLASAQVTVETLDIRGQIPDPCAALTTTNVKTETVQLGAGTVSGAGTTIMYTMKDDLPNEGDIESLDLDGVAGNFEICRIFLKSSGQHTQYTFNPCVTSYAGMSTPEQDGKHKQISNVQFCVKAKSGTNGDPHFTPWVQPKFDFHGQCDLVFMKNPEFNNGEGFEVQIRTEIVDNFWSYIKAVAVKIGDKVLEIGKGMEEDPYFVHNDSVNGVVPDALGDYKVKVWNNPDPEGICQRAYKVMLDDETMLLINVNALFMSIDVPKHTSSVFSGSYGMLGEFDSGSLVGTDLSTVFTDMNAFGQEWQVREGASLFSTAQLPQYPEKCIMPKVTSRRLRGKGKNGMTRKLAEEICSGYGEDCVFDVMVTGDARAAHYTI